MTYDPWTRREQVTAGAVFGTAALALSVLYIATDRTYDFPSIVRDNTVIGRPIDSKYAFDSERTRQEFITYSTPLFQKALRESKETIPALPFAMIMRLFGDRGHTHLTEPLLAKIDMPDYNSERTITRREIAEAQARSSVLVAKLEPVQ